MKNPNRRKLLAGLGISALGTSLHPIIARALEIPAQNPSGTIMDIKHIVILTQENRSFDHYFGTMSGVQGYGDRFAAPAPNLKGRDNQTVFVQPSKQIEGKLIAPFHADTQKAFKYMRLEGTPHTFPDAQAAWDDGRLSDWPAAKYDHSMAYFTRTDIPFQYSLAEAFTLCDAYHCAIHAGTDPNRLFIFTGTNDPLSKGHGPVVLNAYDQLGSDEHGHGGYEWTTYAERLQAAGIDWQVYQIMGDNYDDNSLVGFKTFRAADKAQSGPLTDLARRATRTRGLDLLKADVMGDKLPQISYVVAPDRFSEHPGPSSPAQGAEYTAQVIEALISNPEVWAKTVLLINFDENDGLFDHVPPPAPPSIAQNGEMIGASQIDTTGEYYLPTNTNYTNRAFGLGPRVPLYVVSPFSKGGYVNSQVFDHTSIIRFLEERFGIIETNISPWRRAVCGDLKTCFDFKTPDKEFVALPETSAASDRAHGYILRSTPPLPRHLEAPVQETGLKRRRALPYKFEAKAHSNENGLELNFINDTINQAIVFHLYDKNNLAAVPKRFTIAQANSLATQISGTNHNLFLLGSNGFHRQFRGTSLPVSVEVHKEKLALTNHSNEIVRFSIKETTYRNITIEIELAPNQSQNVPIDNTSSHSWYEYDIEGNGFYIKLAGHIETGETSYSDPAAHGAAKLSQS